MYKEESSEKITDIGLNYILWIYVGVSRVKNNLLAAMLIYFPTHFIIIRTKIIFILIISMVYNGV